MRTVIALAGSAEKAHFCAQLGADVAVDTSATDFVAAALEATGGRGVDVAFDTIGGEITTRTFRLHGVRWSSRARRVRVGHRGRGRGHGRPARSCSGTSRSSACASPTSTTRSR